MADSMIGRLTRLRQSMLVCLALLSLFTPRAYLYASDEEEAREFFYGIAETIYIFAWPTAEFNKASFQLITPKRNGFDLVFKLSGKNGLDGSNLWLTLLFEVQDGQCSDMQVEIHNAFWAAPFKTVISMGVVISEIIEEYETKQKGNSKLAWDASRSSSLEEEEVDSFILIAHKISIACLNNNLGITIKLWFRRDSNEWGRCTLPSGQMFITTYPKDGYDLDNSDIPKLQVHLDRYPDPESRVMETWTLKSELSYTPQSCYEGRQYHFMVNNGVMGIIPSQWAAGFPHYENIGLMASVKKDQWTPVSGYQWDHPNIKDKKEVLHKDRGYVGIVVGKRKGGPFPIVVSTIKGFSAHATGIEPDMEITSVNDAPMYKKTVAQCVESITGKRGSSLTWRVRSKDGKVHP